MNAIDLVWIAAGVVLGVVIVVLGRRARPAGADRPDTGPGVLGWATLALGILTLVLAFVVTSGLNLWVVIGVGIAALIVGVAALRARDRGWPTWVGLLAGVVPALFWGLFALGYGIIALTGCPDDLREVAQRIEPPPGVEVRWEGTERNTCRAEVTTSLTADEVIGHYEAQFQADGWEPAAQSSGMKGVAATQGDLRFEVGWVQPPGEDAFFVLTLEPAR